VSIVHFEHRLVPTLPFADDAELLVAGRIVGAELYRLLGRAAAERFRGEFSEIARVVMDCTASEHGFALLETTFDVEDGS
jgi:hypothetical protein